VTSLIGMNMDQDRLFIHFMVNIWKRSCYSDNIQKLTEVAREAHSTHFKDIVA